MCWGTLSRGIPGVTHCGGIPRGRERCFPCDTDQLFAVGQGVAARYVGGSQKGYIIPLYPTTKLHGRSRIPLDPMAKEHSCIHDTAKKDKNANWI